MVMIEVKYVELVIIQLETFKALFHFKASLNCQFKYVQGT